MVFEEFNNINELNKTRTGTGEILSKDNPLSLIQGNMYKKKIKKKKGNLQFDASFPGLIEGMTVKKRLDKTSTVTATKRIPKTLHPAKCHFSLGVSNFASDN